MSKFYENHFEKRETYIYVLRDDDIILGSIVFKILNLLRILISHSLINHDFFFDRNDYWNNIMIVLLILRSLIILMRTRIVS